MDKPLVSIVNATYNQSKWVKNLLESLKRQSYQNLEIIIVSDGCTDDTEEVCSYWMNDNPGYRFKFIDKHHEGVQQTRNRGLDEATGKYVMFPDSDCYLRHDCIEKMVEVLESGVKSLPYMEPVAYVYCNMVNVGHYSSTLKPGTFDPERLKRGNYIPVVTLMKREGCPRWDPNIKRHQDYDLWLSWLDKGYHGYWLDNDLFIHNTRADSLTFTSVSIQEANHSVWKKHGLM